MVKATKGNVTTEFTERVWRNMSRNSGWTRVSTGAEDDLKEHASKAEETPERTQFKKLIIEGNKYYKANDLDAALEMYLQAVKITKASPALQERIDEITGATKPKPK